MRRVAHVGHNKVHGYTLRVIAEPIFRAWLVDVADKGCAITGHHFCNLFGKVWDWESKKEVELATIPITEEQARKMDMRNNSFWFLEPDEDEEPAA